MMIRLAFLASVIFLLACDKSSSGPDFPAEEQCIAWSNRILEDAKAFKSATTQFKTATASDGFLGGSIPSDLETKFEALIETYAGIEYLNIGIIRNDFLLTGLASKPVNVELINQILADESFEITETSINQLSAKAKGIYALEYLLFSSEIIGTTERKEKYVRALATIHDNIAISIADKWLENLANSSADVSLSFSGFRAQLLNAQLSLLEDVSNSKLGRPLGLFNGGEQQEKELQYVASKKSLLALKSTMNSFMYFNCTGTLSSAEWLKSSSDNGENYAQALIEKCMVLNEKLEALTGNELSGPLTTNTDEVMAIYTATKDVLSHYKLFVIPTLGVTVTFTDNDGD